MDAQSWAAGTNELRKEARRKKKSRKLERKSLFHWEAQQKIASEEKAPREKLSIRTMAWRKIARSVKNSFRTFFKGATFYQSKAGVHHIFALQEDNGGGMRFK